MVVEKKRNNLAKLVKQQQLHLYKTTTNSAEWKSKLKEKSL